MTKTAKNSTVDMIQRTSSSCLISELLWDRAGGSIFETAGIDCISAIVPAVLLRKSGTVVAYVNESTTVRYASKESL
jgi:hypothetical protein